MLPPRYGRPQEAHEPSVAAGRTRRPRGLQPHLGQGLLFFGFASKRCPSGHLRVTIISAMVTQGSMQGKGPTSQERPRIAVPESRPSGRSARESGRMRPSALVLPIPLTAAGTYECVPRSEEDRLRAEVTAVERRSHAAGRLLTATGTLASGDRRTRAERLGDAHHG